MSTDPCGYKCPPKHSQFKKGESGNLSGRPKGRRSFIDDLRDELDALIKLMKNGEQIDVSNQRAMAKVLVASGVSGNLRAIELAIAYAMGGAREEPPAAKNEPIEDAEIIATHAQRAQAADAVETKQNPPLALPPPSEPN